MQEDPGNLQLKVLEFIRTTPGVSAVDVARHLKLSVGNVTGTLTELTRDGKLDRRLPYGSRLYKYYPVEEET